MPKTNTERIRDLEVDAAILNQRVDGLSADMARLERRLEETDRRLWTWTMTFVGAFLAVLAGPLVTLRK